MIFATIILLTVGSIAPLITARSKIDVSTNTSSYPIIFNNQQLVQVQVSRWTEENELVTSIEFWPQNKVDGYLKDMRNADVANGQHIAVLQQYGLIPQDKTQDDLENFFAEQIEQNQQISKKYEKHIEQSTSNDPQPGDGGTFYNAEISGVVYAPFFAFRIPAFAYIINSDYGGEIKILLTDYEINLDGNRYFDMFIFIWAGIFVPPLKNFMNRINRAFGGVAGYLSVSID